MPLMPLTLIVHLPMVMAVSDSVAVPCLAGFLATFADSLADLQVSVWPISEKTRGVPFARLALKIAPGLTAVPPALLMVSTWGLAVSAAPAATGAASAATLAAAIAR